MNHTLFHFGFNKQVETKSGKLFEVSAGLSKAVELPDKPVKGINIFANFQKKSDCTA